MKYKTGWKLAAALLCATGAAYAINLTENFNLGTAQPLDSRSVVVSTNDVSAPYEGMLVYSTAATNLFKYVNGAWEPAAPPETDPTFTAWDKSTGISIAESQITDLQSYLTAESDPAWHSGTGAIYSAIGTKAGTNEVLAVSNRVEQTFLSAQSSIASVSNGLVTVSNDVQALETSVGNNSNTWNSVAGKVDIVSSNDVSIIRHSQGEIVLHSDSEDMDDLGEGGVSKLTLTPTMAKLYSECGMEFENWSPWLKLKGEGDGVWIEGNTIDLIGDTEADSLTLNVDPVLPGDGDMVGNRDYNDARYAPIALTNDVAIVSNDVTEVKGQVAEVSNDVTKVSNNLVTVSNDVQALETTVGNNSNTWNSVTEKVDVTGSSSTTITREGNYSIAQLMLNPDSGAKLYAAGNTYAWVEVTTNGDVNLYSDGAGGITLTGPTYVHNALMVDKDPDGGLGVGNRDYNDARYLTNGVTQVQTDLTTVSNLAASAVSTNTAQDSLIATNAADVAAQQAEIDSLEANMGMWYTSSDQAFVSIGEDNFYIYATPSPTDTNYSIGEWEVSATSAMLTIGTNIVEVRP